MLNNRLVRLKQTECADYLESDVPVMLGVTTSVGTVALSPRDLFLV